jgi:hypothetical protein
MLRCFNNLATDMIRYLYLFLFVFLVLFSGKIFAWNFKAHVVIAEIAYQNLTPEKKKVIDNLAEQIFKKLPKNEQKMLSKNYPEVSTFAKLSILPDQIRNWHLKTVFNKYNAVMPDILAAYANQNSAQWHFVHMPYPDNFHCLTIKSPNVVTAIHDLETVFKTSSNVNTKAISIIFLTHLVADIHQPLHTISQVNSKCVPDKNGNTFCLRYSKTGKCNKNLHSLWDSAVNFMSNKINFQKSVYKLQTDYPKADFIHLTDLKSENWVIENKRFADFIYNTPVGENPTPDYYQRGQLIAKSQIVLAGYRLAEILNNI